MPQFRKMEHLERLAHRECKGLLDGACHIMPKLDGTNASVWWNDEGGIQCGSRNRVLSESKDNHGFWKWVHGASAEAALLRDFFASEANRRFVVYGEWLCHMKTYVDGAWKRFWIFDVFDTVADAYVPFGSYVDWLDGMNLIHPVKICNPSLDDIKELMEQNTFLIKEGEGLGEGLVIKNYAWANESDRQVWGKVVREDFNTRSKSKATLKGPGSNVVEDEWVDQFCTPAFVNKTRAKVVSEIANHKDFNLTQDNAFEFEQEHKGKVIPQLLGRAFHELIEENTWTAIKKMGMPTVDFARLRKLTEEMTKQHAQSLFTGIPDSP